VTLAALRARYLAEHDPARVRLAEARALFAVAAEVYRLASERRELAERALERALAEIEETRATEGEWSAVCHGLAVELAARIEAAEARAARCEAEE
jgi:hypothetical protein